MPLTVFSDPKSFARLAPEWRQLLSELGQTSPFFSPEFADSWWETHSSAGQLQLLIYRDSTHKLRAVFPLYVSDKKVLTGLADRDVSDYFDFLVAPGISPSLVPELAIWLLQQQIRAIEVISLPEESATRDLLGQLAKKLKWTCTEQPQTVCPVIALPATWTEYLTQIGKKQRHEIKRKWKKLEEVSRPSFELVTTSRNLDQNLAEFIRLHALSSSQKAGFWTQSHREYFHTLLNKAAQRDWLKLFFLQIQDQRVASMLCFDDGQTLFLYNSGYDPGHFAGQSVGNVLTSYTIRHAIEAGRKRYDFLRGEEAYKFRFGAAAETIFDITLMAAKP